MGIEDIQNLAGVPLEINKATGETYQPPGFYPVSAPLDGELTDGFQELEISCRNTLAIDSSRTIDHTMAMSRRQGTLTRWETSIQGSGTGSISWMARGDGGQALIGNERWQEKLGLGTGSGEVHHNPTIRGAGNYPPGQTVANRAQIRGSPVVFCRAESRGDRMVTEGCTIPFDFDSLGFETGGPLSGNDRGGDGDNIILWHNMRQYERVECNFAGLGGVTKVTQWSYFPFGYGGGQNGGVDEPFRGWFLSGMKMVDYFGIQESPDWYDPTTQQLVTNFGADYTGNTSLNIRCNFVQGSQAVILSGDISRTDPFPFAQDRYAATVIPGYVNTTNPSADFSKAIYWRLDNKENGCTAPNQLGMVQSRVGAPAPSIENQTGQQFSQQNRTDPAHTGLGGQTATGRVPGWVGHHYIIVEGTSKQDAIDMVDFVHERRLLDGDPEFSVPRRVIEDMNPIHANRWGPRASDSSRPERSR